MKIKNVCDLCGRKIDYPFYAFAWDNVICFECVWKVGPEYDLTDKVILPSSGGAEHGQ